MSHKHWVLQVSLPQLLPVMYMYFIVVSLDHPSLDKVTASEHELDLEFSVRNKLAEVKHLTAVVDKLREIVSEQFATRASNACHVQ